jgi:hypothetical protein
MIAALALSGSSFMAPTAPASKVTVSKISMNGKGFGGGEATRDPAPTAYDPNDPKGKQQAIHKAESFADYLARRNGGGAAAPAAAAAAAPAAGGSGALATLQTMNGPEIFWGADGVELGYEESDIKGYEGFGKFCAALSSNGVDIPAGCTVLAPADSAFDKFDGAVTADILKYHIIPGGKKTLAELTTDQATLQGGTLTSYRKFRKNWLDNAIVGLKAEGASKSASWPADVDAGDAMIQSIDTVLVPGGFVPT